MMQRRRCADHTINVGEIRPHKRLSPTLAVVGTGFTLTVRGAQSARSIRSLAVYACDAPVHELSELKARPGLWRPLHSGHLAPCQRDYRAAFQPAVTATCIRVRLFLLMHRSDDGRQGLVAVCHQDLAVCTVMLTELHRDQDPNVGISC